MINRQEKIVLKKKKIHRFLVNNKNDNKNFKKYVCNTEKCLNYVCEYIL